MIGQLKGKVVDKTDKTLLLDVGGVGFLVKIGVSSLTKINTGQEIILKTYLAVRDNALELFGFADNEELDFFGLLIGVSGIGPKSALAILDAAPPDTLRKAVAGNDAGYLTKVSGIGKKNAEKIVLALKDKLGELGANDELQKESDELEALKALGFTLAESRDALRQIPQDIKNSNERIKAALKILAKQ